MTKATGWTLEAGFPTFAPLFAVAEGVSVPLYLTLLNVMGREEAQVAIRAVRQAVESSPDTASEVVALFTSHNWRPHLVGAVAVMTGVVSEETLRALWIAFDSGSWVSPQLAVTAFRCDPEFEAQARRRIEVKCPINTDRLGNLQWLERHSAAGPLSFDAHSSKALAALVTLCKNIPSASGWLQEALKNEAIQNALEKDVDGGDGIAMGWRKAVEAIFEQGEGPQK